MRKRGARGIAGSGRTWAGALLLALSQGAAQPAPAQTSALEQALAPLQAGDHAAARALLEGPATAGDAGAAYALGVLHDQGLGVTVDPVAAAGWYARAVEAGFPPALRNLGRMYLDGRGVEADAVRGGGLLVRALEARVGCDPCGFDALGLGLMLVRGWDVGRDPALAVVLFREASEAGDLQAQIELAQLLEFGTEVPADPDEAYLWYGIHHRFQAEARRAAAARGLERLRGRLSAEQVTALDRRIAEWVPAATAPPAPPVVAAEPVPLSPEPEPAPGPLSPPSPPDPTAEAAQALAAYFAWQQALPCAELATRVDGPRVRIEGRVARQEEVAALRERAAELPAPIAAEIEVDLVQRPACTIGLRLAELGRDGGPDLPAPRIRALRPDGTLRGGDSFVLEATAPPWPAHVYVDYVPADGGVVHLFPEPGAPDRALAPRAPIVIGAPEAGGPTFVVGPPYGEELVIVLAAPVALFSGRREAYETAESYLASLEAALARTGAEALVARLAVVTRPGPP